MQPPDVFDPAERLSSTGMDAMVDGLRRLANPQIPRSVRAREVVVTLRGASEVIYED